MTHPLFVLLNLVYLTLFSDFYRNFASKRLRDTLVGDVQQTNNTPYYI